MWKGATLFGVAVLAGLGGARMRPMDNPAGPAVGREARSGDRAKPWSDGDLLGWIQENDSRGEFGLTPNPVAEDLKAWSDEELRGALDAALRDPSTALPDGRATTVIGWLIAEWMSRDPDAVVAWFEGLGAESKKRRLASWLGAYWPPDRAEEGLAMVIRNREFFDNSNGISSWAFVQGAIGSAARRGPAAVDAVLAQLRAHKLDPFFSYRASFPEGFDFAALAASPAAAEYLAEGNAFFAGQWMKEDPEGAFDHFNDDLMLKSGAHLRLLFLDVMPGRDTFDPAAGIERAEWLASRIESMEPDERRKIARESITALEASPAVLGSFVAALDDPAMQVELSRNVMRTMWPERVLDYFEATGGEGQRLQLLEEAARGQAKSTYHISEATERLMRERLAAWNASPERIEAIIRSVKGVAE